MLYGYGIFVLYEIYYEPYYILQQFSTDIFCKLFGFFICEYSYVTTSIYFVVYNANIIFSYDISLRCTEKLHMKYFPLYENL